MSRIAYTDISYRLLESIFKSRFVAHNNSRLVVGDYVISSNLPLDTRIVKVLDYTYSLDGRRDWRQQMRIYWESSEFEDVPEGVAFPEFQIIATREESGD